MSGSRLSRVPVRGSSTGLLDQVIARTGSPDALLASVLAETETLFLEDRVRRLWARQAFRRIAGRMLVGPQLATVMLLVDMVEALEPNASDSVKAWLFRELAAQMRGDGTAGRLRPLRGAFGAPVIVPGGWQELDPTGDPQYEGNPAQVVPQEWTVDLGAYGKEPGSFPEFLRTPPIYGERVGQLLASFGPGEWSVVQGYIALNRTWGWSGEGGPLEVIPGASGVRLGVVSPSGLADPHPRGDERRRLGRTMLPSVVGGERNIPFSRQRRLDQVRQAVGLSETVSPVRPVLTYRPDRAAPVDSLEVYPRLREGPPHKFARPGARRREIKLRVFPVQFLASLVANAVTETGDFIEQIWKSLPKEARTARLTKSFNRRIDSMLIDIFRNPAKVDWDKFKAYYEVNQMEDLYYGGTSLLAAAAGLRTGRAAGGFGMGHALGLHGSFTREWGGGVREGDPVSYRKVDPIRKGIDAYQEWAISSRRAYRRTATYLE